LVIFQPPLMIQTLRLTLTHPGEDGQLYDYDWWTVSIVLSITHIYFCMTHSVSFLDGVFSSLLTIVLSLVALLLILHILLTHHPYLTHTRLLSLLSFLHCFPFWTMRSHLLRLLNELDSYPIMSFRIVLASL
jgi:hypothetical protein